MENLGEIFVQGKIVNLDTTSVQDLEKHLQKVQNEKCKIKENLDSILEEIYN